MDFLYLFEKDFHYLLPELFLTSSILILLVYGVLLATESSFNYPILVRNVAWLSIISLSLSAYLLVNQGLVGNPLALLGNLVINDSWTQTAKVIICLSGMASILIAIQYLEKERLNDFEFSIIVLLAILGMLFIVSSDDLMSLYMSIELQSLSLYVLACYKRNSVFSVEAGLKYFVLGAFSSGLLLFGISLLYGFTGCTHLEDLGKLIVTSSEVTEGLLTVSNGIKVGLLFVGISLLFKIYAVPFHLWVPDVYQGSPTAITSFFAITPSLSVVAVLSRLFYCTFHDLLVDWQLIIVICSCLSILIGSLGAIAQKNIKRFLAYSAIGHVGYFLMALATGTSEGLESLLLYIIIYIITSLSFFTILLGLRKQSLITQSTRKEFQEGEIETINQFQGLARMQPVISFSLAVLLFSMAGIPPLAGFFSKLYVFLTAVHNQLFFLVFVGILGSVLGAVYYLRIIRLMYFGQSNDWETFEWISKERSIISSSSIFFVLFFFLYPTPLLIMIHQAVLSF